MSLQFVIDGYNCIHHATYTRTAKERSGSRKKFLDFIRHNKLTGSKSNKVTVVFDGFPVEGEHLGADNLITAVFSRKICADEKIRKIVEESGNRRNIIVVTADRELQFAVKSAGSRVMTVDEFLLAHKKQKRIEPETELNYSQKHAINEELRKIWLK